MIKKSLLKIVIGVLAAHQLHAIPVTLNFDNTYHTGSGSVYRQSYQDQGYNIASSLNSSVALGNWGTRAANFAGSMALYNNYLGQKTALTRVDGGSFDISSIDLSELFKTGSRTTVAFTGFLNGDSKVTQSFTLDGTFGFQTFLFDTGFSSLKTLEWAILGGTSAAHMVQFDNLVLGTPSASILAATTPVPEGGSTLIFLGLTLLVVLLAHRKLNAAFKPAGVVLTRARRS